MPEVHVVVLAAGKGTRMKSARPKVLHQVAGRPMVDYVLDAAEGVSPDSVTMVAGHMREALREALAGKKHLHWVTQDPQLGTGHALLQASSLLEGKKGLVLLLSGDVPLLQRHTLRDLVSAHLKSGAAATVLTAIVPDPHGYGRIVRVGKDGPIQRIVEERDAAPAERAINEINSGIWVFALDGLFDNLRGLATANAQGEYYLTDLVEIFRRQNRVVETSTAGDHNEIRGINSRSELAEASRIVRQKKNEELMAAGVTLEDPATTYVDDGVTIGTDTVLHPGVYLEGSTRVGSGCEIHSGVRIVDSEIADRVTIQNHCVINGARVAAGVTLGPFVHIRPGSELKESVHLGNFVEIKKSIIGAGTKAGHLSYLGDAVIGENVNIGAGTITCNYDGTHKHQTVIEDGAFVGSDTQLVAPVKVGKGAYIGSGTTVREDVPPGALGVSAGKQRNIHDWAEQRKLKGKK